MKTTVPPFGSDAEAEAFVEAADLQTFDLSGLTPVRFELQPKDKSVSLRLPESLLAEVRSAARREKMPTQRYIRLAIERALRAST